MCFDRVLTLQSKLGTGTAGRSFRLGQTSYMYMGTVIWYDGFGNNQLGAFSRDAQMAFGLELGGGAKKKSYWNT